MNQLRQFSLRLAGVPLFNRLDGVSPGRRALVILFAIGLLKSGTAWGAPAPQHHFSLDEAASSTSDNKVYDQVGTREGDFLGGVMPSTGAPRGTGIIFDGVDDRIELTEPILIENHQDFTIMAWIRPDVIRSGSAANALVPFGHRDGANYIRIQSTDTYLKWNDITLSIPQLRFYSAGTWQHFALRRSADEITVFRDGVANGTGVLGEPFSIQTFGAKNQGSEFANHMDGRMDDIRIFRGCALSDSDILATARHRDSYVNFSAMGCGPYNHPLDTNGFVETDSDVIAAFWNGIGTQYPSAEYLTRDDEFLWRYVARETFESPRSEFLVHLGDMMTGRKNDWPEARYLEVARLLGVDPKTGKALHRLPQFTVPGDNEWSDQTDVATAYSHLQTHFGRFHEKFVDGADLPRFPHPVSVQPEQEENFNFVINGVQFLGLTIPGGSLQRIPDWTERIESSVRWINRLLPTEPMMPTHRYQLDENLAIAAVLDSGSGLNPGMNAGATVAQAGRILQAYQFDGVDDHITFDTPFEIDSNENFTVCAWIRPDAINAGGAASPSAVLLGDDANENFIRINTSVVRLKAEGSTWDIPIPDNAFTVNTWQHFALTRSGGKITAWRNGVPLGASQVHNKALHFNRIGSKDDAQFYGGLMDEVILHIGASLTEDELRAQSFLQAHWRFDDASNAAEAADRLGVHSATKNGAFLGRAGMIGRAAEFAGSEDLAISPGLDIPADQDFTMGAWVRPDVILDSGPASPAAIILGQDINDTYIRIETAQVQFKLAGNFLNIPTDPPFSAGDWQHFLLSRDQGRLVVFRNGEEVGSIADRAFPLRFNRIGSKNSSQFFDGRLDDLRVYAEGISRISAAEMEAILARQPHATVVMAQASVNGQDFSSGRAYLFPFIEPLIRGANAYRSPTRVRLPILYLQADEHRWKEEDNYLGEANMKRLVLNAVDSDHPPTQITVTRDTNPDFAFLFNRRSPGTGTYLQEHDWSGPMVGSWGFELWTAIHFEDPDAEEAQPDANPDDDNQTNWQEYLCGGDPWMAEVLPRTLFSLSREAEGWEVEFNRLIEDLEVRLEAADDLEGAWVDQGQLPMWKSPGIWSFPGLADTTHKFYRLHFRPYQ